MTFAPPPSVFGACDPGKTYAGLSIFRNGRLVKAVKLHTIRWPEGVVDDMAKQALEACVLAQAFPLPLFVGEYPEIRYNAGVDLVIATAESLLPLPFTLGVVAMACGAQHAESVKPSLWKGNIDPDKLIVRIRDGDPELGLPPKVDEEERRILGKQDHNVVDSCGLGLWRLGRLHPSRR